MLNSTDPTGRDRDGSEGALDEDATEARVGRVAARVASSDLDPESLELIMAALAAEACDGIEPGEA